MTGEKLKNVKKELELLISIMNENDIEIERNLFNDLKDVFLEEKNTLSSVFIA